MTPREIGYLAGIIDGEGSIILCRSGARASSGYIFPLVKIANTNKILIDWLDVKFPKGRVQYRSRMNERCKDVYHWTVASNNAINLLSMVEPYLLLKRRQAEIALPMWSENAAELKTSGYIRFGHGNPVPARLKHFREACFLYIKDLNRRGSSTENYGAEIRGHLEIMRLKDAA